MKLAVAFAVAALAGIARAHAQTFPSKPITMIVPFPAGGGSDILARIVSERMKVSLGQPVIIENVGGAGGTIGTARVVRSAPDGYTIGFGQWSSHVGSGALYPLTFDLLKDLAPIARLTMARLWIIGRNDLPAKDLRELIAWLKANPNKATAGSIGAGSGTQLCFIDFQNNTGTQVPARAVSGRGSDHAGFARRSDRPDVPGGRADAGALPQRQDQGLCGDGHDALVCGARRADHRRGRRAGTCT